jgi:cell wall-associated NlpC family hydrolase
VDSLERSAARSSPTTTPTGTSNSSSTPPPNTQRPPSASLAQDEAPSPCRPHCGGWLGTPYSWGGGGPSGPSYGTGTGANTKGFDCSGLAQYAWAQAGIPINRVAADQYNDGPHLPRNQLQPGDLLFFATNPSDPATIHHVALYLGGGQMIHAPHTGDHVRISPFAGVPSREAEYAGATRPGTNH